MWHIEVCGSLLWATTFQNVGDSVANAIVSDNLFIYLSLRKRERVCVCMSWGRVKGREGKNLKQTTQRVQRLMPGSISQSQDHDLS